MYYVCFADTTNQLHLQAIHKEYEKVCQTCLDEIENIKVTVMFFFPIRSMELYKNVDKNEIIYFLIKYKHFFSVGSIDVLQCIFFLDTSV